jgi:pimeloyl-ACP methyl ester carboxylesterase
MDEKLARFYKSEKGYQAMTDWYNALVSKFDFDYESIYLDTRYGKTHAFVSGAPEAQPLILVQGLAGNAPLWYQQIPVFAEHFRVYALDIPGQPGRSDLNPPPFAKDGYTYWIEDMLKALKIGKAHFLAVSTGGWFLTKFAIYAPDKVGKMVLVSPTGLIRARIPFKIWLKNAFNIKKDGQLSLEKDLNARDYFPEKGVRGYNRELAKSMALSTRHFRLQNSVGVINEKTGRVSISKGIQFTRKMFFSEPKKVLRLIQSPALVILGSNEVLYNPANLKRRLARLVPSYKVEIIPDSGHSVVFDNPELFNKIALDYLLKD